MRSSLRFLPSAGDALEIRLALSHVTAIAPAPGAIHIAVPRGSVPSRTARLTPVEELHREFASFRQDVRGAAAVAAQLGISGEDSGGDFPAYVSTRVQVMAENLASTFPTASAPARRPGSGKWPGYRFGLPRSLPQAIAVESADRLEQAVLAIPGPSQPGPEVARYNAALDLAIEEVRTRAIVEMRSPSQAPGVNPLVRRQAPSATGAGV